MAKTDIIVPTLGESVTEATVAGWLKKPGDAVALDEVILELETDKITLEINATSAGVLSEITANEGDIVNVGDAIGTIDSDAKAAPTKPAQDDKSATTATSTTEGTAEPTKKAPKTPSKNVDHGLTDLGLPKPNTSPTGRRNQAENPTTTSASTATKPAQAMTGSREEVRVKMSRLRQRIAERLKDAQNTAAMLTTFNEVDMSNVMNLRKEYKDAFEKKHGIKLGFMSFFAKAVLAALQEIPEINACIEKDEIVYKNYYDIGIAVGTENGLVVPVLRDVDGMSFADIEATITDYGKRARAGKLSIEELTGGTFTITNGGIFGSLLSTPILNPPQSAILGMHKIQERPVVIDGDITVRPMMYLALSYDHRIVDGKEAVTFLVKIKDAIENPERLLLDI